MRTHEISVYDLTSEDRELVEIAKKYSRESYIHRRASIGAALRVSDQIVMGLNCKEDSMQFTSCAGGNAIRTAWSLQCHDLDTIVEIKYEPEDDSHEFMNPCGICAQLYLEHGLRRVIILDKVTGVAGVVNASSLLPFAFRGTSRV